MAEELRKIMAELGFRMVDEMVGRTDMLVQRNDIEHWKAGKINLSSVLHKIALGEDDTLYCTQKQDHGLENQLDHKIIKKSSKGF